MKLSAKVGVQKLIKKKLIVKVAAWFANLVFKQFWMMLKYSVVFAEYKPYKTRIYLKLTTKLKKIWLNLPIVNKDIYYPAYLKYNI